MKNYTKAQAISALTKKGVIITTDNPLTKRETTYESISMKEVQKAAENVGLTQEKINELRMQGKLLNALGITPKKVMRDLTVQQPNTVNVGAASGLGNGSWGKIDFLVNHCGFNFTNQFIDNREITFTE
jgi:hypothetical protein